jgi:hypothetical protein
MAGGKIFHGNEVKAGVHLVVCGVGFLENILHFMQNSAHAKGPKNLSGPHSARHQAKRKIGARSRSGSFFQTQG